jgi:heme-degrading monooxygenase HmoA
MGGYATVWEFRVRADRRAEFERHYGPDGTWAALFRRGDGYIGTQFLKDRNEPLRYLTIDHWTGCDAYRAFRAEFPEPYASLDRECGELMTLETALGEYDVE